MRPQLVQAHAPRRTDTANPATTTTRPAPTPTPTHAHAPTPTPAHAPTPGHAHGHALTPVLAHASALVHAPGLAHAPARARGAGGRVSARWLVPVPALFATVQLSLEGRAGGALIGVLERRMR
jgi:hypothetical protein